MSEGTWEKLSQVAAKGAEYNSRERHPHPKCLEGTRVALLNYIYGLLDKKQNNQIIWLHGTAGVGKSAVAFTVAERMKGLKVTEQTHVETRLAGTFFFSRKHTKWRKTGYFFATLAYQLAVNFPSVKTHMNRAILENPALLDPDKCLRDQMEGLFLRPLRNLRYRLHECGNPPLAFVIDALDECTSESLDQPASESLDKERSESELAELISLLAQALRDPELPVTHILVTSRLEGYIREVMQNKHVRPLVCEIPVNISGEGVATTISLDGADVDEDIYHFLEDSFRKLQNRYSTFPQPTKAQLERLASRAGRRFIVATTMIKFIDDRHKDPRDQLELMLELTSQLLPGTEVYKLYDLILSTCADPTLAYMHLSIVAALADPLPISQISELLGPGQGRDVDTVLIQLRSIINVPTDSSLPVNIYHSSVRDYISHRSNCCLRQVQYITSPHSLLAFSSLHLMIREIPESVALLDVLSELKKHSQTMEPQEPQNLKQSLSFMVQPPEPVRVLTALLWLRGNYRPELQFWLDTPDGRAWLQTKGVKDWLLTQGGIDWLLTDGGEKWLRTQGAHDWLQTEAGRDWLQTVGGHKWLQKKTAQDWLQTEGGKEWLRAKAGKDWLQTAGGDQWFWTRAGRDWLQTNGGKEWLRERAGKDWLQTLTGRNWLATAGRNWLETDDGKEWLREEVGQEWLRTMTGQGWLETMAGQYWLETNDGKEWLREKAEKDWLETTAGRHWLETTAGKDWLETTAGKDWLKTKARQDWLETDDGKEWLRKEAGQDWQKTMAGQAWLGTMAGQAWLETMAGQAWQDICLHELMSQIRLGNVPDWIENGQCKVRMSSAPSLAPPPQQIPLVGGWLNAWDVSYLLQAPYGRDWLQTKNGEDWMQTGSGRDWLQNEVGQDWLQTLHGKEWRLTTVWVTMEEFSSTSEAIRDYAIAPESSLQPAFQAIQLFKTLPDFLMFPVFLALRHQDHSTTASPEMDIIRAIKGLSSFADEVGKQSRLGSGALKYACQNWAVHLSRTPKPWDERLAYMFQSFWNRNLVSWLERQWCLKDLPSCLTILSEGEKLAKEHLLQAPSASSQ